MNKEIFKDDILRKRLFYAHDGDCINFEGGKLYCRAVSPIETQPCTVCEFNRIFADEEQCPMMKLCISVYRPDHTSVCFPAKCQRKGYGKRKR